MCAGGFPFVCQLRLASKPPGEGKQCLPHFTNEETDPEEGFAQDHTAAKQWIQTQIFLPSESILAVATHENPQSQSTCEK